MTNIKFSHHYPKIWNQKKAELIAVRILDAQAVQINKVLVEYDTRYNNLLVYARWDSELLTKLNYSPEMIGLKTGYYPLPEQGKLIQLIFVGDKDIPFCTLRRHTPKKYDYYKSCIHNIFDIVIEDTKK